MRISDWSSDVCSSDFGGVAVAAPVAQGVAGAGRDEQRRDAVARPLLARPGARFVRHRQVPGDGVLLQSQRLAKAADGVEYVDPEPVGDAIVDEQPVQRSEEHTSELQSLMRISYAVFCLQKQTQP